MKWIRYNYQNHGTPDDIDCIVYECTANGEKNESVCIVRISGGDTEILLNAHLIPLDQKSELGENIVDILEMATPQGQFKRKTGNFLAYNPPFVKEVEYV